MNDSRHMSLADKVVGHLDQGLRTVFGGAQAVRANPAAHLEFNHLSKSEGKTVAGLMRVNHAGEVAAQALYQGQALTAKSPSVRKALSNAAQEENDHLAWCRQRLDELDARTSLLDPLWYSGSFVLGAGAGLAGDRWSLGFLAETERQVVEHLEKHLERLPAVDERSRVILEQMRDDEAGHATLAVNTGAAELPGGVKKLMRSCARLMTRTAFWL